MCSKKKKNTSEENPVFLFPAWTLPSLLLRQWITMAVHKTFCYGSEHYARKAVYVCVDARSHRLAAAGLSPIAMTRDSHSSDRGRLVGGATHRLKVKPCA